MIRKILMSVIAMSIFLFVGIISYATTDNDEAIDLLNTYRENLDVVRIDDNYELRNAALYHAKYMSYYDTASLIEESGNLYYRGRYTLDRASYFNYEEPFVSEMIIKRNTSAVDNMQTLLDNPYSRITLLDPKFQDIAVRENEGYYSFIVGGYGRKTTESVIYPYNNQKNIPITWTNNYTINPYLNTGESSYGNGLPITYSYYSKEDDVDKIRVDNITIKSIGGDSNIPIIVISSEEDKYLNNSIIILPTESYDYGTKYKVTIDVTVFFDDDSSINEYKTVYFETVKDPNGSEEDETNTGNGYAMLTRADFTVELVEVLDYDLQDATYMTFNDVDRFSEEATYIFTAYANNLIKGKSETEFAPNDMINRQEAYTILVRAFEDKIAQEINIPEYMLDETYKPTNDYVNVSSWAKENGSILKSKSAGFLVTNTFDNLVPNGHINVNEFDRLIELFKEALEAY